MRTLEKLLTAVIVSGFAVATMGCTEGNTTVFVRHMIDPEIDEDSCLYDPAVGQTFIAQGVLDYNISLSGTYAGFMSVGNQLINRGDPVTLKPESNRIQFFEVEVQVFDFAGGLLSEYTVPANGFADPANGTEPSYGAVGAVIVDNSVSELFRGGNVLDQTVVSRIIVRGETLGGTEVETAPWDFPIFMCSGCLGCKEPELCDDDIEPSCNAGQDFPPDCRTVGQSACN